MEKTGGKAVTLKYIAGVVGCNPSTVSVVLNGAGGNTKVSDELRDKIVKIARELNYHPNSMSQSLRRRSSRTLGVFVGSGVWHSLGHSYEMVMFRGVEQVARRYDYDLLLLNMNFTLHPDRCYEKLASHRIDGLVLMHVDGDLEWVRELQRQKHNVVLLDSAVDYEGIDSIGFNSTDAVHTALRHLRDLGHRRVGFIGSGTKCGCVDEMTKCRMCAFQEAASLEEFAGMELLVYTERTFEITDDYCQLEGVHGTRYFMSLAEPPTAVITYNSLVGMCAKQEAERLGMQIPRDLSIIGIDRAFNINSFSPGLTAVDHPLEQIGASGTELLIAKIENREGVGVQRSFRGDVIDDTTTAPPRIVK